MSTNENSKINIKSKKYLDSKLDSIEYIIGEIYEPWNLRKAENIFKELAKIRRIINVQIKSGRINDTLLINSLNKLQQIENLCTAVEKCDDILIDVNIEMEDLLISITKWNRQYNKTKIDLKSHITIFYDIIYPNQKINIYPNIESEFDFNFEFNFNYDNITVEKLNSMYQDTQIFLETYKLFISKIRDIHKHPLIKSFSAKHKYPRTYLNMIFYIERLHKVVSITANNFSKYTTIFIELLKKQDKGIEFKKLVKDPVAYLSKLEAAKTNALIINNKERFLFIQYETLFNDTSNKPNINTLGMAKALNILTDNQTKMDLCADIGARLILNQQLGLPIL